MSVYFARLFPYSPREGFRVRNFTTCGIGFKGGPRPAWYRITGEQKEILERERQNPLDRYSKPLFQFATEEERSLIEEQERTQLIAASMLSKGAIIDPEVVPRARVIDLTGGISDEPISGGRADAIPPARDIRPEVTATAGFEADADLDDDIIDEPEVQKAQPAFVQAPPQAPPPMAVMPSAPAPAPLVNPKQGPALANKQQSRRGRPRKLPPVPGQIVMPKPLGGPITSKDLGK